MSALVTAEIAIAIVLLVAAGLFVRSAMRLDAVPLGYRPDAVLTARVTLPAERYADPEVVADAYRRMLVELRATAGVDSAGASTNLPLGGNSIDASLTVDGRDPPTGEPRPSGHVRVVTDEYLETIGVRRVQGRLLEPSDMRPGAPAVVVINERLAGILWPDGDPIGQRLSGWTAGPAPEWREVVGVVADARTFGPDEPLEPELFVPYTQAPSRSWDAFERSLALAVRGPGTAATHAAALRRAVRTVDPSLPLYELRTMDAMVADSTAPERFRMRLFGLIAAIAILLAAVGVYGVIAYYVTLRTREIGIRVALGARRGDVLRMVVRRALAMTGLGVAVGLLGAAAVTRYLENLLFEVTPLDPATFAGVAIVFTAIAVLASYLPARRAARLEPLRALRHE